MTSLKFHRALLCLLLAGAVLPAALRAQQAHPADSTVIRVLYFHGTIRCHTCLQIEEFTKLTMQLRFEDGIRRGSIVWMPVDYEKENDTSAVRRYGIENQALIISKMINGREIAWRKLEKVWKLVNDFNAFQAYVALNVRRMSEDE
jgi:hypothetical protein